MKGRSRIEIDELKMTNYIWHFRRLSSLSLNKLVKVGLDLSCFLFEFNQGESERSMLAEPLSGLSLSKTSLKEIDIEIYHDLHHDVHEFDYLELLTFLTRHLIDYPNLKRIEMEAPTAIHLVAGEKIGDLKRLKLMDSHRQQLFVDYDDPDLHAQSICLLIQEVVNLVGVGLNEFSIDTDENMTEEGEVDPEWCDQIVLELWNSRETLRTLILPDYTMARPGAWNLFMKCRNLQLRAEALDRYPKASYEEKVDGIDVSAKAGEVITPEELERAESFKNVLVESEFEDGWRSMLKWIGSGRGLENLKMTWDKFREAEYEDDKSDLEIELPSNSINLGSILLNARETLKYLKLFQVGNLGHQHLITSSTASTFFPPFGRTRTRQHYSPLLIILQAAGSKTFSSSLQIWMDYQITNGRERSVEMWSRSIKKSQL